MLSWSLPWELMRFVCTHESHEIAEEVPREKGDRPWQSLLPLGSRAPPQSEADDPWAPAIHTWSYGAPWSSHAWLYLSLPSVEHAAHPSVPPAPSAPTARNPKVNHEPGLRRPRCSDASKPTSMPAPVLASPRRCPRGARYPCAVTPTRTERNARLNLGLRHPRATAR